VTTKCLLDKVSSKAAYLPEKSRPRRRSRPFHRRVTELVTTATKPPHLKSVTKAKVLIVHFIPLVCFGVAQMLSGSPEFDICDFTDDAPTARRLFERHRPRVAIVGPALRGGDGIQLVKDFCKLDPHAKILMLSAHEDGKFIQRALRAGAMGYLRVLDGRLELLSALRRMMTGHRYVSHALTQAVYHGFATREVGGSKIDNLSDREREAFFLISKRATLSEIAQEMGVTVNSVQTYLKRIKGKLGVQSNSELREKAARAATKRAWKKMEESIIKAVA